MMMIVIIIIIVSLYTDTFVAFAEAWQERLLLTEKPFSETIID